MKKTIKELKEYTFIKWSDFASNYCGILLTAMTRHMFRGLDGHNKEIELTEEKKQQLQDGLHKFGRELQRIKIV